MAKEECPYRLLEGYGEGLLIMNIEKGSEIEEGVKKDPHPQVWKE